MSDNSEAITEIPDSTPAVYLTAGQLRELVRRELEAAGQSQSHGDRNLTVPQVAERLQKSPDWVYRHKEVLPMRKIGRELRCSERELDKWLAAQRRLT